jgi:putative endopeptidase
MLRRRLDFSALPRVFLAAVLGSISAAGVGASSEIARPQDDFYMFINQLWLESTEIPKAVPWISPFVVNTLRVQARIEGLILESAEANAAEGTDRQRIGDLFRSFMDKARVERAGLARMKAELQRIKTSPI